MASFDGARPGFVFKRDVAGTGYYPDKTDSSGSLHTAVPSCHYDVLGVAMDASEAEVRQAYRKRALQYHPDRSDSAGATALFQAVQASYAVLSDPDERAFYDRNRDAILASRKPKRETAGSWSSKAWTRTVDDTDIAAPEPDGVSLWPLFSPLAYPAGVADGPNGFYSAMGAAFAEVGAEEDELLRARGEAPNERPLPPFGTAESMGDAVEAFYTRWARFETCRTGAGAERHGLSQIAKAATKQQRGAMTAENERLKAESRRARTECGKGPKKKERDPEAAAKAKEGMVMARAIAGLACKVCGATFPNRQVLLKHINKTGHLRDPNEMNLPEGMFYIPDMSDKPGLLR